LLRQALDSPAIQANAPLHTILLSKASHLEYRLDRYLEAEQSAKRVLSTARRGGSRAARLQALSVLGTCAFRLGRLTEARRRFKEALDAGSPEDPAELLANTLDHLALIEKALGNYEEASSLALKSLAEYRRLGDSAEEALCLNNLGSLQLLLGEDASAAMYLREGLAICERDGLISTQAFILTNLTEVAMRSGDLDGAEAYCARASQTAMSTGNRAVAAWAKIKSARVALQRGALDGARARLAESLTSVIAIGVPSLKTDGLICFAQILVAQGESACARAVTTFVLSHPLATAATRKDALARLSNAELDAEPALEWPGIDIDDLIGRVVLEAGQAYAPLIAALRGAH
jgi:tetratricopeptide (TPR) repeat protein